MRTSLKVIVIIGILLLCAIITMAINGGGNSRMPLFLMAGAVAGIRAVWKYNPEKESTADKQELDKTD